MTGTIRSAREDGAVEAACEILMRGGLVALPTETVYGLAADASNPAAVARIYAAKGRPDFNPLIVHVDGLVRADELVALGPAGRALAEAFWPGPLTLVARIRPGAAIAPGVTAGLDTMAVRCPDAPVMRRLIAALDTPLAAPSANPSGRISPTTADHVADGLGEGVDLILDGGPCRVGVESAIVDVSRHPPRLLRPGGVSREALEAVAGPLAARDAALGITAPGQLSSHYAPEAKLRLNASAPEPGEAWLGFGADPDAARSAPARANLSAAGDPAEAAANLFAMLRRLDASSDRIAVAPIPSEGLGEAINDRLRRAAAPRKNPPPC